MARRVRRQLIRRGFQASFLDDVLWKNGAVLTGSWLHMALNEDVDPPDMDFFMPAASHDDFVSKMTSLGYEISMDSLSEEGVAKYKGCFRLTKMRKPPSLTPIVDVVSVQTGQAVLSYIERVFPLDNQKVAFDGKTLHILAVENYATKTSVSRSLVHQSPAGLSKLNRYIDTRMTRVLHPVQVELSRYKRPTIIEKTQRHWPNADFLFKWAQNHRCWYQNHEAFELRNGYICDVKTTESPTLFLGCAEGGLYINYAKMHLPTKDLRSWFRTMETQFAGDRAGFVASTKQDYRYLTPGFPYLQMERGFKDTHLFQTPVLTFELFPDQSIRPTTRIITSNEPVAYFFTIDKTKNGKTKGDKTKGSDDDDDAKPKSWFLAGSINGLICLSMDDEDGNDLPPRKRQRLTLEEKGKIAADNRAHEEKETKNAEETLSIIKRMWRSMTQEEKATGLSFAQLSAAVGSYGSTLTESLEILCAGGLIDGNANDTWVLPLNLSNVVSGMDYE